MLQPGDSFDGYRVIRLIGSGGFGAVWLCQSEALGDLRALKFIPAIDPGRIEKEFDALCRYRTAAGKLRSPSILPIEHVNRRNDGLFYIMPLADGYGAADPMNPAWRPLTMAATIENRRGEPTWFTSEEIKGYITPILQALQLLSDAGLVHRDVKPDNILFLNGTPCLGDISLLGEDSHQITRRGTPGYSAPSWFVESGGNPDMFGAATTLYSLLTGNPPDKMGRAAFRWPPRGEDSLPVSEKQEWQRIHRIIRRAVDERPAERFQDFATFTQTLETRSSGGGQQPGASKRGLLFAATAAVLLLVAGWLFVEHRQSTIPKGGVTPAVASAEKGNIPAVYREDLQSLDDAIIEARKAMRSRKERISEAVNPAVMALKKLSVNPKKPLDQVVKGLSEIQAELAKALEKVPVMPRTDSDALKPLYALEAKIQSIPKTNDERVTYDWEVRNEVADRIQKISQELEEARAESGARPFSISDALAPIEASFEDVRLPDGSLDPRCKEIEKLVEAIQKTTEKL